MAPLKIDTGIIVIFDIGKNTAPNDEDLKKNNFFEEARSFTTKLIERKIISESTDYIGIVILGSEKTENNLNNECGGGFRHIKIHAELDKPTWQLIDNLPDKPTNKKGDWFDACLVAVDHFKNGVSGVKITNKKIVLVTNFEITTTQDDGDQIQQVLLGLQEEDISVDVIGINLEDPSYDSKDFNLARQLVEHTDGATASFDCAMGYLQFQKKRKSLRTHLWNAELSIGPNIKIPITAYIRLKDEAVVGGWKKQVKNVETNAPSTTESIFNNKQYVDQENQAKTNSADLADAYLYGQEPIPIEDCKSMFYESGPTCLSLYGFTKASNVKWHCLNGSGLEYVFGRKGDSKAKYALKCLVECLKEHDLYGIARRVYRNNCAPKMYALMPVIDVNNYLCLSMAQLCYKEEIKHMSFPPTNLKKYNPTDKQVKAFKDLITNMDLTNAYDDTFDDNEAFPVGESVSPAAQYMFDCIVYRARNPDKPLPPPRDEIMNLFKVPELVEKRSKDALENIKELFPLKKVEVLKRRPKKLDDNIQQTTDIDQGTLNVAVPGSMPTIQLPSSTESTNKIANTNIINRIGTIDPLTDYKTLKTQGKTLEELNSELIDVIEELVNANLDGGYTKAFQVISFFRDECVQTDPNPYNKWLLKFKNELALNKNDEVLTLIKDRNVNLILKSENELSRFESEDSHQESQLYENDTIPDPMELSIPSEIDIFDQM